MGGGCFHSSDGGWGGHDRKVAGLEGVGGYNAGAMTTDAARANSLYYGDNLTVMREHVPDESVDLVYLDPPFNSNASYNVLFKERTGEESPAQIRAFTDTWEWTQETERTYEQDIIVNAAVPTAVKEMIGAFRQFIGNNAMMAYLVMMAPRLVELHRVLKPTGSIYLHCDPTASHYLKILMDTVFGKQNFRSEIVWRRNNAHNKTSKQYGPIHDTILFYSKGENFFFSPGVRPLMRGYVREWFTGKDEIGHYRTNMLTGPGTRTGPSGNAWRGFDPTSVGRHWAIPASLHALLPAEASAWTTQQMLDALDDKGFIYIPRDGAGQPKYKQYVSEGYSYQDIWAYQPYTEGTLYESEGCIDADVKWLERDQERLGYPTQKPVGLLSRIISSSSQSGDVVLDPFCGCGTAVAAAEKLGRRWIGIDITHLAVALMKNRLKTTFNIDAGKDYRVVGEPEDVGSSRALWEQDAYQFQYWAMSLLEAQPRSDQKKGADRGVDGLLYFIDGQKRTSQKVVVQVKGGHVSSPQIRDLKGTVEREKAAMGLFITLEEPTGPMRTEAVSAGFYHSDIWQRDYPKIQLRTVEELLAGQGFELPSRLPSYEAAQRHHEGAEQGRLA